MRNTLSVWWFSCWGRMYRIQVDQMSYWPEFRCWKVKTQGYRLQIQQTDWSTFHKYCRAAPIVSGSVSGRGVVENIDAQTFSPMWEGRRTLLMDCHLDGVVQLVRLFTVKVDQHDQNKDSPNEVLYREKWWEILHETKDMKRILNVLAFVRELCLTDGTHSFIPAQVEQSRLNILTNLQLIEALESSSNVKLSLTYRLQNEILWKFRVECYHFNIVSCYWLGHMLLSVFVTVIVSCFVRTE